MSKVSERKEFFDLIKQAARDAGGIGDVKESKIKNCAAYEISVKIGKQSNIYNMKMDYDLDGTGSVNEVLTRLFGRDRANWPTILPGSKKPVNIADARRETTMRQPRPARTDILMMTSTHKPTGSFAALSA